MSRARTTRINIPMRQYAALLEQYLRPQWKPISLLALLLLGGIALQLVNPQIIRYFIDTAQETSDTRLLFAAAGLFIGVSLFIQIVSVAATYIGENVGWTATNKLRSDLAKHCLKLDMSFHKSHTSGSLIERVDGDVNALANFFSNLIITLFGNLLLMVGILVLLFRESLLIGGSMLAFAVFAVFILQHIRKYAAPLWGRMRQMSADFYGFVGEHIEGTEDTRANGATGYVLRRFFGLLRKWLPIRRRAFLGFASMWITTIIVFTLGNAVAFVISAFLWKKGAITLGTVYMIFYYTELLQRPIEKIRTQMEDLQRADASIARIRELLGTEPRIVDGPGAVVGAGPLSVRFEKVTFGYEEDGTTLDGIDFAMGSGKVLGLLGRTGSGKSTLARLLLRFYDPRSGCVWLDGVDVREMRLPDLRKRVRLVTQNIELFHGTVRDNLTFYDESIRDERIVETLRELGLGAWLDSHPGGLDAMLQSGGGGLSAGEAQLLAFARVFLADPGLVILDEASSRLDPATELHIERAIDKLLADRTCIIIAHRLSTIQRADDILILEDGKAIEFGGRERLAADPSSRFSRLLAAGMEEVLA